MKQLFKLTLAAVLVCTACSNDRELGNSAPETSANAIGFQVIKKNVLTRGGSTTIGSGSSSSSGLEDAGHYNFGVFAYKNTDADYDIMANYLVGYHDTNKGYDYTTGAPGWYYQGLGYSEYQSSATGYYNSSTDGAYMSNIDKQYLRYWDKSSSSTEFFAYAPYINDANSAKQVTLSPIENGARTMKFPAGSIVAGYDDCSKYEYMYVYNKVVANDYGNPVQLQFNRLTAKINIKFFETIAGYQVKILNLKEGTYNGVCAAPAVQSGSVGSYTYSYGTVYKNSGLNITFSTPEAFDWDNKVAMASTEYLSFEAPTVVISETNTADNPATPSATTYYAIPKAMTTPASSDGTGLTFHVTYQLISSTDETITVHNATVFVPAQYCQWVANYSYTYVFKITKDSTGSTANPGDGDIDPTNPVASSVGALFPIEFNNCTGEAWDTESEHEANIN